MTFSDNEYVSNVNTTHRDKLKSLQLHTLWRDNHHHLFKDQIKYHMPTWHAGNYSIVLTILLKKILFFFIAANNMKIDKNNRLITVFK